MCVMGFCLFVVGFLLFEIFCCGDGVLIVVFMILYWFIF